MNRPPLAARDVADDAIPRRRIAAAAQIDQHPARLAHDVDTIRGVDRNRMSHLVGWRNGWSSIGRCFSLHLALCFEYPRGNLRSSNIPEANGRQETVNPGQVEHP